MTKLRLNDVCSVLYVVMGATLLGCRDVPSAPETLRPEAPRFSLQSFEGQLGILDPNDSYATMDLPEYSEAVIVEIGIGGTINTVSDPRTYAAGGTTAGRPFPHPSEQAG
jgi:hypothetical protein